MNESETLVIGVLGGMGTYATLHFFEQYAKIFPAEKEWDRPRIIIDNNCTMPSRVRAILYNENVDILVEQMTFSIKNLIHAGANKIILACNTSHLFLDKIYKAFPSAQNYVVNIIHCLRDRLIFENVSEVYLLATEGTILSGIYQNILSEYNIKCTFPSVEDFPTIRNFIEAVKQDKYFPTIFDEFNDFIVKNGGGRRNVILGCTELPVLYDKSPNKLVNFKLYDPLLITLENLKNYFDEEALK